MNASLERFARRWWAGDLGVAGRVLSAISVPASWAWARASRARTQEALRSAARVDGLRVISVGNLAVGGTGKTPMTAWIARVLQSSGAPTCVLVGGAAADEALLHRRWNPTVPVLVGRERVESARAARAQGARVAVLDDGFQHVRLARDLDIVLLSADDPFPAPTLPGGPYREAPDALGRAGAVVVTRRSASADEALELTAQLHRRWPGLVVAGVHLVDGAWTRLDGGAGAPPAGAALAVCAVARPDAFLDAVRRRLQGPVDLAAFPDHHAFTEDDARRLRAAARGRPLALTEKDAVKLETMPHLLADAFVLADEMRWDWGEEAVRARILTLLAEEARP